MKVRRIKSKVGGGWLRQIDDGQPIVTGIKAEARQFSDQRQAAQVARQINSDRRLVPVELVEGEPSEPYSHGEQI